MLKLAVIGAGTIGRTHIERALSDPAIQLVGVCDPSPAARSWVQERKVDGFDDHLTMLRRTQPDGVVVATPNDAHANVVLDVLEQGAAVLVEKPIADTVDNARRIHRAAIDSGLPVLVGHQRRYNPIMRQARDIVASGLLGRPVCVTALSTWYKDDDYFKAEWRTRPGGGPVLINLIHDLDLLRFLYGDIESLHALSSNAVRGHPVEDTAVLTLRFANGALGTVTVSDAAAAPWNYDLAAHETTRFPQQDINSHFFSGTEGSLTLPRLECWRYRGTRSWEQPIEMSRSVPLQRCPYQEQLRHFAAVISGTETPVCSALDGLRALEAAWAVRESSASGQLVRLPG